MIKKLLSLFLIISQLSSAESSHKIIPINCQNFVSSNTTYRIGNLCRELVPIDHPHLEAIDNNLFYTQSTTNKKWFLDDINYQNRKFSGENVNVYVIDSGIQTSHVIFDYKARPGYDFVDNTRFHSDPAGHGTHVAGIIHQVAPNATIFSVRVLNEEGYGSLFQISKGFEWVVNHDSEGKRKIINLSLGGRADPEFDKIVNEINKNTNIIQIAAAGNYAGDTCNFSPAKADGTIAVSATNYLDLPAFYSNYGKCTDIWAPGSFIYSSYKGDTISSCYRYKKKSKLWKACTKNNWTEITKDKYLWNSGTSMASPVVAGMVATYLEENPFLSFEDIKKKLKNEATKVPVNNYDFKNKDYPEIMEVISFN